jgi:hypothetical protein
MYQVVEYLPSSPIQPLNVSTDVVTSTIFTSGEHLLRLDEDLVVDDRPVHVVNDDIKVNGDLMEEGQIYPIRYKGENYYLRKLNEIVELFQLNEE